MRELRTEARAGLGVRDMFLWGREFHLRFGWGWCNSWGNSHLCEDKEEDDEQRAVAERGVREEEDGQHVVPDEQGMPHLPTGPPTNREGGLSGWAGEAAAVTGGVQPAGAVSSWPYTERGVRIP
jgi:hypothetical protein